MVEEPSQRRRAGRDTGRPRARGLGSGPMQATPARASGRGGRTPLLLVLVSNREDTTAVDLASGAVVRLRVPWPQDHDPDLAAFDVVEATLARDPERDDLAQPEAATAAGLPRPGRHAAGRARSAACSNAWRHRPDGPLLGFPGPAAPYWEFRGKRPSVALIEPTRGPQLFRRPDGGVHLGAVRLGPRRRLAAGRGPARRSRPGRGPPGPPFGKGARRPRSGSSPSTCWSSLTRPRDGHCYKVCTAVLPEG